MIDNRWSAVKCRQAVLRKGGGKQQQQPVADAGPPKPAPKPVAPSDVFASVHLAQCLQKRKRDGGKEERDSTRIITRRLVVPQPTAVLQTALERRTSEVVGGERSSVGRAQDVFNAAAAAANARLVTQMPPPPPRPLPRHAWDWDCGHCGKRVFGSRVAPSLGASIYIHICSNCNRPRQHCNRPRPGYERQARGEHERLQKRRRKPERSGARVVVELPLLSREWSSSQPSERSGGSRGQASHTSKATSQFTLHETGHLLKREGERAIVRRELQSCLKHGRARRTGGDKWEVEYDGLTLVTNDNKKIGVTAYWTGGGGRPDWAEKMEVKKQEDEQLLREGSTSVFFPFDLTEDRLPPLPESPRGTPRSELGSISHASPRSEPESPRSAAPSEGVEAADNRGFDDAAEAPEQP